MSLQSECDIQEVISNPYYDRLLISSLTLNTNNQSVADENTQLKIMKRVNLQLQEKLTSVLKEKEGKLLIKMFYTLY